MAGSKARTPRLGRGLSSLMTRPVTVEPPPPSTESKPAAPAATLPPTPASAGDGLIYVTLDRIRPNPHQPRQQFGQPGLERLAESIRHEGVMQPIVVRPRKMASPTSKEDTSGGGTSGGGYEIVAGERRWRAAKLAGLKTIPAVVRDVDDRQLAEWALIENLQREDLNPLERAEAFQRLIDRFSLSHEQIAQRVGVDRSTITNTLRLLNLCEDVQQIVREGLLAAGHARALVSLPHPQQQVHLARRIVREGLSARQVETAVRKMVAGDQSPAASPASSRVVHLTDLERQMIRQLGTKVRIQPGRKKGAGKLTIHFQSLDQFDDLLSRLGVKTE